MPSRTRCHSQAVPSTGLKASKRAAYVFQAQCEFALATRLDSCIWCHLVMSYMFRSCALCLRCWEHPRTPQNVVGADEEWAALSAPHLIPVVAVDLTHSLVSQQFSANSDCRDLAVSHPREVGMNSTVAPPTFGTLQQQTPALPGQPVPAHQPTQPL